MKLKLYNTEGKLKGFPTKMHVILIMWAYTPDEKKIKELIKKLKKLDL